MVRAAADVSCPAGESGRVLQHIHSKVCKVTCLVRLCGRWSREREGGQWSHWRVDGWFAATVANVTHQKLMERSSNCQYDVNIFFVPS